MELADLLPISSDIAREMDDSCAHRPLYDDPISWHWPPAFRVRGRIQAFAGRIYSRFASTLPVNMKPQTLKPALISVAREAMFRMSHRAAGTLPAR
jgi:hypothetical protein